MATSSTWVGSDNAKKAVDRILDDMFSQGPKGSYIEWYTDLYNLARSGDRWWTEVMPDVVADGVEARLMRDPTLARFGERVKRATDNVINSTSSNKMMKEHIEVSISTAEATCRSKALAWKMFRKSREARGLPEGVLDEVRALI